MKVREILTENKPFFTDIQDIFLWVSQYTDDSDRIRIAKDGTVNLDCNFAMYATECRVLPVKFGKVNGNFKIKDCNLTSLVGTPREIIGTFNVQYNLLKNLIGGPEIVTGEYDCSNGKLTSLEGSPRECETFQAKNNKSLVSLKGGPQKVKDFFVNECEKLKSLEGGPTECTGTYNVNNCDLRSLAGAPRHVNVFGCASNIHLKSLEGAPEIVDGNFVIDRTPALKSLHGIHKIVKSAGTVHFTGFKTDVLGLLLMTNQIIHSLPDRLDKNEEKLYYILKQHMGDGKNGVMKAQIELIEAGLRECAKL